MTDATKPPRLLVLAGATATGKTALAVSLAERLGGELVGADSIQLYRRLDVGSAKPRPEELRGVPHHLLDVADLDEPFDAARYVALADAVIADVRARGRVPVVVGGTGLYLRALVRGLASGIPADPSIRDGLRARAAQGLESIARMHAELAAVDPEYAAKISPTDPIRVVRALEVFAISGEPLSAHHRRHAAQPPRYDARFVALEVPRPALVERIAARTRAMLAGGWVEEVRAILADGYAWDAKPLQSVGYAEVVAHARGELPAEALEAAVVKATKGFAKRQRTWFRGEEGVTWVTPEEAAGEGFLRATREFLAAE
ncbi:MAG: tRNA (adenosine(37)-N6)-dimethylallyltransferase MiaA [Polyangiales bacterium]